MKHRLNCSVSKDKQPVMKTPRELKKDSTSQIATRTFATRQSVTRLIATTVQLLLVDICYYSVSLLRVKGHTDVPF